MRDVLENVTYQFHIFEHDFVRFCIHFHHQNYNLIEELNLDMTMILQLIHVIHFLYIDLLTLFYSIQSLLHYIMNG